MSDSEELYETFENDALYLKELIGCELEVLKEASTDILIEYAKRFIYLQARIELLSNKLSSDDRYVIDEYFDNPNTSEVKDEPEEFIAELAYLVNVARQHSDLLRADKKAMEWLARDDPGTYAKTLAYRRNNTMEGKPLGRFTENILSSYFSGNNRRFDRDHTHWFVVCESGLLGKKSSRVSLPLDQLIIDDHFSK